MIESRIRNSGSWIGKARIALVGLACASAIYGFCDNILRGSTAAERFKDNEIVSEYFRAVESSNRINHIHGVFNEAVRSDIAPKRTGFPYEPGDVKEDLETIARAPEEVMDSLDQVKESLSMDVARMEKTPEVKDYHRWRNDTPVTALALAVALGIVALLTYPYQKIMEYASKNSSKAGGE